MKKPQSFSPANLSKESKNKPPQPKEDDAKKPFKKRSTPAGKEDKKWDKKDDRAHFFSKRNEAGGDEKKPFRKDAASSPRPYPKRTETDGDKKPFPKKRDEDLKPFAKRKEAGDGDKKPFRKDAASSPRPYPKRSETDGDKKPFPKREDGASKPYAKRNDATDGARKPFPKRDDAGTKKPFVKKDDFSSKIFSKKKPPKKEGEEEIDREQFEDRVYKELQPEPDKAPRFKRNEKERAIDAAMTLNKYIAHSGECGRREAAGFVKQGKVRVNGELVLEPGYRVQPGDEITLVGKKLTPQKNNVYVLLNKPKGFITTTDDPQERKTVMDLVSEASNERLYPVGRLDRNTTGLLLLTNDGTLAHKLSHPSYSIKKVYQVSLDKNLTKADYQSIANGIELEDGIAQVDEIAYLEERNEIGLEIHSGKNRIVRRIFESLGYAVEKLDRMMYAGLTKKNLPRGKWRILDEKEIIMLKHFKS